MKNLLENKMYKVFIGVILLIIVIFVIAFIVINGKNKTLTDLDLSNAAKLYYQNNQSQLPKENYDSTTVSLATLIANGYIDSNKEGANCPSYVIVTNMNGTYSYTPFIKCNTSNSNTTNISLVSKLTSNVTTTGSGLYNHNGKYVFKGENPNNYIKFADSIWRIIGLDENNNIKIIYSDIYVQYNEWDNRYNKDINKDKGINEYVGTEKSRIKEYLDSFFTTENNIEKYTAARIARTATFNTCIGKININTGNTNICSKTINSRISTITVDDYLNASLDTSCNIRNTINCRNYNYLNLDGWTINADSSNTYQAYYIDKNQGLYALDTSLRGAIRPIIALKNDTTYLSGSGTSNDPYLIN